MQQPLAIAVIGGLITNMLLTRLLIPVGYLALEKVGAFLHATPRAQFASANRNRR